MTYEEEKAKLKFTRKVISHSLYLLVTFDYKKIVLLSAKTKNRTK